MQVECRAHYLQHDRIRFQRSCLNCLHRQMEELVHQSTCQRLHCSLLFRTQRLQTRLQSAQLSLAHLFSSVLQIHDHGSSIQRLCPSLETSDFLGNNCFGPLRFASPFIQVRCGNGLKVIYVVEKDALYLVHFRVDVARYGNVDEEHGTISALVQELLRMLTSENIFLRSSRCDDDVGLVCSPIKIVKTDSMALKVLREAYSAVVRSVGH